MQDRIERTAKGSLLQHGKSNNRVYLMKLKKSDLPDILFQLNDLARINGYTKIFCKVPSWAAPLFTANGFILEAQIPRFYQGQHDVFFMSKFLDSDRIMDIETDQLEKLYGILADMPPVHKQKGRSHVSGVTRLGEEHADEVAGLYRSVFQSYPFPVFNPEYIRETIQQHIQYYGIAQEGKLIALASAETDLEEGNAEMTDFAVLPAFRGRHLSVDLLSAMEKHMKKEGITTLYTIARLNSLPMNRTFLSLSYRYAGTLIKNTHISGRIESMNVFYKHM